MKETDIVLKYLALRNVEALTAPYFHDGTQATLDEIVKAMAKYEIGVDLNDQEISSLLHSRIH